MSSGSLRVDDVRNMRTFRLGINPKKMREVRGLSYRQAATLAARKLFGRGITVERVTGFDDMCGYFQAYQTMPEIRHQGQVFRESGKLKIGAPFWIQRMPKDAQPTHTEAAYNLFAGLHHYPTMKGMDYGNNANGD